MPPLPGAAAAGPRWAGRSALQAPDARLERHLPAGPGAQAARLQHRHLHYYERIGLSRHAVTRNGS